MIKIVGVSKLYPKKVAALINVTFRINKGEFVFLVGPSGAGKSTILKILLKETSPSMGHVIVMGKNVTELKRRHIPLYRRKIGMVFQDFRLLPNKTAYENVAFAMEAIEAPKSHIKKQVPRMLGQVGLKHKLNSFPSELSGGEQQRVALARAMVNNPEIIIADEPTGNLDPVTSNEIFSLLNDINSNGTTILVATHELNLVEEMKKRVIYLEKGRVARDEERGYARI